MNSGVQTKSASTPQSSVNQSLISSLAQHLVDSDNLSLLVDDLAEHPSIQSRLRKGQSVEQVENALSDLLEQQPELLQPEDQREVLQLPEDLRGEALLERLLSNSSNQDS